MAALLDATADANTVVFGMPHAEYLSGPGLARSELARLLDKSPYHVRELERDDPARPPAPEPSPQMFAGTLLHCALLEPDQFLKRYAIGPVVSTRAAVAWKEFVKAHPQRECITPLQAEIAHRQAEALRSTPMGDGPNDGTLGDLLAGAVHEASAFWRDPATGLLCKCRPDSAVTVGDEATLGDVLIDIKTTVNAKPDEFNRSVTAYHYDMQDSYYCVGWAQATGRPVHTFIFACVESEFPHATALYTLPEEWRAYGWQRCRQALELYAECERTGRWPGYGIGVLQLAPPRWHPLTRIQR
jgi:hypothetical protein